MVAFARHEAGWGIARELWRSTACSRVRQPRGAHSLFVFCPVQRCVPGTTPQCTAAVTAVYSCLVDCQNRGPAQGASEAIVDASEQCRRSSMPLSSEAIVDASEHCRSVHPARARVLQRLAHASSAAASSAALWCRRDGARTPDRIEVSTQRCLFGRWRTATDERGLVCMSRRGGRAAGSHACDAGRRVSAGGGAGGVRRAVLSS